ncbi:MAG: type III-B CRISPR-associated protein Cas10/Cmr2 [Proteobacteria bacterium]|nr:type III-B CRISPR-associated protein Cas10/Cmr2 [Pseudomonadota bacterium]
MNPAYALALALGPVGPFISAGRRSRDLWYGSRLLSELTRQTALRIAQVSPDMEFWTPRRETLDPEKAFFDATGMRPHEGPVISNKIRVIVPLESAQAVRELLQETDRTVRQWLCDQLQEIKRAEYQKISMDTSAFEAQLEAVLYGDFMEFTAGFSAVTEDTETGRHEALERAQRLRDARKNARVFVAPSWTRAGHVRSSLEQGRDAVLVQFDPTRQADEAFSARIERERRGLRPDEKLDAIGLLRRFAALRESELGYPILPCLPFPPLSRVAIDPWLVGFLGDDKPGTTGGVNRKQSLDQIRRILNGLSPSALSLISSACREPGKRPSGAAAGASTDGFPFDASLLFDGGLLAAERELGRLLRDAGKVNSPLSNDVREAGQALRNIRRPLQELHGAGMPGHYYAYLTADGDGVGQALSKCTCFEDEQKLVGALDAFAQRAWHIVGENHRGFAFYIGGDELCAYLPLDLALPAAKELAAVFQDEMKKCDVQAAQSLTLSIGLVVAHVKHDLRDIRRRGEGALQKAKKLRRQNVDGTSQLVVDECVAGAADRLSEGPTFEYVERMKTWLSLLEQGQVSLASVHGLSTALPPLEGAMPEEALQGALTLALAGPILAAGRRKETPLADCSLHERLKELHQSLGTNPQKTLKETRSLVHEFLLAHRILGAHRQRIPNDPDPKENQP